MSKKIIIVILAMAVMVGALFVLTRKRYQFDFEGRVKLLEQVEKVELSGKEFMQHCGLLNASGL